MKYLLWPIRSNCFDFDALLNQQEQGSKIVIKVMAKLVMDMPIKVLEIALGLTFSIYINLRKLEK